MQTRFETVGKVGNQDKIRQSVTTSRFEAYSKRSDEKYKYTKISRLGTLRRRINNLNGKGEKGIRERIIASHHLNGCMERERERKERTESESVTKKGLQIDAQPSILLEA